MHFGGVQQLGVGVANVDEGFAWFRRAFGVDVPVFREAAEAPLMVEYTGGTVHARDAMLAINMAGGGGLEIWQFTSRKPVAPANPPALGDYGIIAGLIKTRGITQVYQRLQSIGANVLSAPTPGPDGRERFVVGDPWGNTFVLVEFGPFFSAPRDAVGGVVGALIGVSDMDAALKFYADLLGYDRVAADETAIHADLVGLPGGAERKTRRVILERSAAPGGPFGRLFGPSMLELVTWSGGKGNPIFADRCWGDLGFIHLCFDIVGMDELKQRCERAGYPFTIDSGGRFDMGEAAGRFSYVEDPDGTWIEFVETHKIPIVKKIGWYMDVTARNPAKPLPNWMIKTMGTGRVK